MTEPPPTPWPTNCTSTSTSRSCTGSITTWGRWAWRRSSTCGSPTRCSSRSGTATISNACRSPWRRISAWRTAVTSTIPSVRYAMSRSITSCRWCPQPPWSHLLDVTRGRSRTLRSRCSARSARPILPTMCAASTTAIWASPGVAADSTTETYAALRLDIDNWRWSGVPFFIRTGKRLPVTQTELRLVFKQPPRLGFGLLADLRPETGHVVVRLDPSTGIRLQGQCSARGVTHPRDHPPRHGVRRGGRRRARPRTKSCSMPRWWARVRGSPARTGSRRRGGSCSRCWTRRPRYTRYAPGSWGPSAADGLTAQSGGWHEPWVGR